MVHTPFINHSDIREELCIEIKPERCGIIIFGASGDLTHRKLLPALFNLYRKGLMPDHFFVLGCARSNRTDETFRRGAQEALAKDGSGEGSEILGAFLSRCHYLAGNYADGALYQQLDERLTGLEAEYETQGNRFFYLATPPDLFCPICDGLAQRGLTDEWAGNWVRVVLEKPFGSDLTSSKALDNSLSKYLTEKQIYRIDHYLGKETVQNILILRFANAIFEPLWNRKYIDHIQITVAESLGVENRAGYYEQAGALRDMFQNHMLQMLALVAMEPPVLFDAKGYRDEKFKLLQSIRPFPVNQLNHWVVRGQYSKGILSDQSARAYCEEKGVKADSQTETYVACKMMIDNWRWQGVPFYLRSGKRLAKKVSEIAIFFKIIPHSMFGPIAPTDLSQNVLVLKIQPEEGIGLTLEAKFPGPKMCMSCLSLNFSYHEIFGEQSPDAYERLLLDCMTGDQALFLRSDSIEQSWAALEPILKTWREIPSLNPLYLYSAGSSGPDAADLLLSREGRNWRQL